MSVSRFLSSYGKAEFFPKKGILAQAAQAKGKTINATIGVALEDDGMPMVLPSVINALHTDSSAVLYAPSYGWPELRKLWQDHIKAANPSLESRISIPIVTNGLTHALRLAGDIFLDLGEDLILPDKFWGNYKKTFRGRNLATFPLFHDGGYNLNGLNEMLSSRNGKQVLLMNFPNNPTGYTPTKEEAHQITSIIQQSAERGNNVVVLLDDAYFGLVYEPEVYEQSLFAQLANAHENVLAVKIDGITKEYFGWGMRLGFLTYAGKGLDETSLAELEDKTAGAVRGGVSNISKVMQVAAIQALRSQAIAQERVDLKAKMKERYDAVRAVLNDNPQYADVFTPLPFNSGYFMCVQLKDADGERTRKRLLDDFDTGLIAFPGNILRVAFSSVPTEKIAQLFKNMYEAAQ